MVNRYEYLPRGRPVGRQETPNRIEHHPIGLYGEPFSMEHAAASPPLSPRHAPAAPSPKPSFSTTYSSKEADSPLLRRDGFSSHLLQNESKRRSTGFHMLNFSTEGSQTTRELRQSTVWWLPEILACIGSMCCVLAIFILPKHYDGKPPPDWPMQVSLNSVVALLSSTAKVMYMVPIVEGLGQLRWLWFSSRRAQSLQDFDAIDYATRGSWGSFRLLVSRKGGILGFLAAFIIITSIASSPMTQQVIYYDTWRRPSTSDGARAFAARTTTFSRINGSTLDVGPDDIINAKRSIMIGAYTSAGVGRKSGRASRKGAGTQANLGSAASLECSSANCTWPVFTSLAVCSKVTKVSDKLQTSTTQGGSWSIPGVDNTSYNALLTDANLTLTAPNLHSFVMSVPKTKSTSVNGPELDASFINAYLIYTNPSFSNNSAPTFEAVEILFHWCTREYDVEVDSGNSTTSLGDPVVRIVSKSSTSLAYQWSNATSTCIERNTECNGQQWGQLVVTSPNNSTAENFTVEEQTSVYFSRMLGHSFGGGKNSASVAPAGGDYLQGLNWEVYQSNGDIAYGLGNNLYPDPFNPSDPTAQFETIDRLMGNIATSMTNWLRNTGTSFAGSDGLVTGTVLTNQVFVVTCWPWLTFLLGQITLTSVFLTCIIIWTRSSKLQIFKASAIASVGAMDDHTRSALGGINDLGRMKEKARNLRVRLERTSSGVGLWLATPRDGPGADRA